MLMVHVILNAHILATNIFDYYKEACYFIMY